VNWCTSCGTALSDDEVEHEDVHGKMYHVRYPYAEGGGFVEVATTRPETMFGDTAVAVHPEDDIDEMWGEFEKEAQETKEIRIRYHYLCAKRFFGIELYIERRILLPCNI
jgi:valyl-tRNA synthetase